MRIADVEVIELRAPGFDAAIYDSSWCTCLVRVHTDEGITGLGEVDSVPSVVRAVVEAEPYHSQAMGLRAVLVGQDPAEVERLWECMYAATYMYGRRGAVIHAMSGIDIALWDIRGKVAGQPVGALLSGRKPRRRVKAYATIWPLGSSQDQIKQNLDRALQRGLRAVKICAEVSWFAERDRVANILRATRSHLGQEIELMFDGVGLWPDAASILPLMPLLRDLKIGWLESPLPLEALDDYALLAGQEVPIGGGDLGMTTRHEFIDMLDRGQVDLVQPDVTMAGGLTELLRIAQEAYRRGKRVVPHGYKTNILNAVNLHFLSQQPREEMLEYSLSKSPLLRDLTQESFPLQADGTIAVPEAPGIGVTLNEECLRAYRIA